MPSQQHHEPNPEVADVDAVEQDESSIYATDALNVEYYSPRSFLSFSSQPGVNWINSKVKSPEFANVAMRIVMTLAGMLKMSRTPSATRAPEPAPEIAWEYTEAYFEEALDATFGIVERSWFESRLRAHFRGELPDDKSWYALRNVLWASGCRIALSKSSSLSFREISNASGNLFENALSVHTEIQVLRASMVGVQALILMAYYSEGMGKVSLQYIMCSNAMRMACSKGLHRRPPRSWNISSHEVQHRNWIFWSIYCLEKQICTRSGRPSVMDDDEIDCQVPDRALDGGDGNTIYCRLLTEMMQLSSTVRKRLCTPRALQQTPEQLFDIVRDLTKRLDHLKNHALHQSKFSLDRPLDTFRLPDIGLTLRQVQSLQSHYFCLVLDINTPLTYPWSALRSRIEQSTSALARIEGSCRAVAQAARSAILATRQIKIDASCPAMIAQYTPAYTFINLFVQILQDANAPTTNSDLRLLDVLLGYVSNVELITDLEVSLLFVRDMCQFARLAVDRNNKDKDNQANDLPADNESLHLQPHSFTWNQDLGLSENDFLGAFGDDTFEMWNTLLPFTDTDDILF
ncbi:uncharacterized protein A1O9_02244 [Exophiala aquamarina CBS 119918]|uniref:Xylanolytic transcriptional activator regulatory domain-containing protein n=1 Tax=Exophiala aquamarina CBS 119918 TaxID=1182545 RepID=A0A072PMX1_9EURO|nr:uncharacterized protein A1O9_02244 [Exophiala aquamarina CBS 119918]KEF60683.1 hypothetical protein A1O9_02244 [Exophiala aquamarina CBS 119918]